MLPYIQKWIKPKTTIISDCWAVSFRERSGNELSDSRTNSKSSDINDSYKVTKDVLAC